MPGTSRVVWCDCIATGGCSATIYPETPLGDDKTAPARLRWANGRIQVFRECGHYVGRHRTSPSDTKETILVWARSISQRSSKSGTEQSPNASRGSESSNVPAESDSHPATPISSAFAMRRPLANPVALVYAYSWMLAEIPTCARALTLPVACSLRPPTDPTGEPLPRPGRQTKRAISALRIPRENTWMAGACRARATTCPT